MIPLVPMNRKQRKRAERLRGKSKPIAVLTLTPELKAALGITTGTGRVNFRDVSPANMEIVRAEIDKQSMIVHECGHAVVTLALGFGVGHISVLPTGEPHAKITLDYERPFDCMVAAYAGAAVERVINQQTWDGFSGVDKAMADRGVTELIEAGQDATDAHERARAEAERMVRHHEKLIRKFAAALTEKKYLNSRDIRALLQGEGGTAYLAPTGGGG